MVPAVEAREDARHRTGRGTPWVWREQWMMPSNPGWPAASGPQAESKLSQQSGASREDMPFAHVPDVSQHDMTQSADADARPTPIMFMEKTRMIAMWVYFFFMGFFYN